ncbi:putative membrane protein [Pediococcus claussenii ATCC BAA-344]|uniref:Membrane protein n=1 Tax=Pediococcus claussenii (strain ATCC BAA-344 / DSM 14800 / JCM 18046 / KCTC 3811 / LMG 21948 / P06) TaxID=701521 RepID=G8PB33_PEDCP|nr:putative membrane protein [Pediococcus claussenii ATCC BAA-344]KRN20841.1 hypothetical protein IV79_GL000062 [Pediococcus claussenii]
MKAADFMKEKYLMIFSGIILVISVLSTFIFPNWIPKLVGTIVVVSTVIYISSWLKHKQKVNK